MKIIWHVYTKNIDFKYTIKYQLHLFVRKYILKKYTQHELDTYVRANKTRKIRSNHPDDTLFRIFWNLSCSVKNRWEINNFSSKLVRNIHFYLETGYFSPLLGQKWIFLTSFLVLTYFRAEMDISYHFHKIRSECKIFSSIL